MTDIRPLAVLDCREQGPVLLLAEAGHDLLQARGRTPHPSIRGRARNVVIYHDCPEVRRIGHWKRILVLRVDPATWRDHRDGVLWVAGTFTCRPHLLPANARRTTGLCTPTAGGSLYLGLGPDGLEAFHLSTTDDLRATDRPVEAWLAPLELPAALRAVPDGSRHRPEDLEAWFWTEVNPRLDDPVFAPGDLRPRFSWTTGSERELHRLWTAILTDAAAGIAPPPTMAAVSVRAAFGDRPAGDVGAMFTDNRAGWIATQSRAAFRDLLPRAHRRLTWAVAENPPSGAAPRPARTDAADGAVAWRRSHFLEESTHYWVSLPLDRSGHDRLEARAIVEALDARHASDR
jgi:hypothetical protein